MTLSKTDSDVLSRLASLGPQSCTEIGEHVWGGKRNRQCYARPAGRVLHRLKRAGLVDRYYDKAQRRLVWETTVAGHLALSNKAQ